MNSFYKFFTFVCGSVLLSYLSLKLESSFANRFAENIIPLLTTLFAINIASSTLIAGKLREIQDKMNFPFTETKKSLTNSFYEQLIIIAVAFVISIIRESDCIKDYFNNDIVQLICNSIIYFCFIYYMDIIRDMGKALFKIIDYKTKE